MKKNRQLSVILSFLASSILVTGCVQSTQLRGYTFEQSNFDRIQAHQSMKEDVMNALGSPTSKSAFGKETWYYMSSKAETIAFLPPKVVEQHVIAISFDNAGIVDSVEKYDLKDAVKVQLVKDQTPAEGQKGGVVKEMLSNLGRFNPDTGSPEARTTSHNPGTY